MINRASAALNNSSLLVRTASCLYRVMVMNKVAINGPSTHRIHPKAFNNVCNFDGTFSTSYLLPNFGRSFGSIFIVVVSVSSLLVTFVDFFGEGEFSEHISGQPVVVMHIAQPHAVQLIQQQRNGTIRVSMTPYKINQ